MISSESSFQKGSFWSRPDNTPKNESRETDLLLFENQFVQPVNQLNRFVQRISTLKQMWLCPYSASEVKARVFPVLQPL